jgi:SAM-dependent methyltransferase
MDFYTSTLSQLRNGPLSQDDTVLVVCGGARDAQKLREIGIRHGVISNLDTEVSYAPYDWSHQDAEALTFADRQFDWAVVHAGLHHCASPHRALLEMCRVTRKGVLVIEARDSLLVRLAVRMGLTVDHELEAVALSGWNAGGVRNSGVPNYIYRWTEREVMKTIESAYPQRANDIRFFYGMRLPLQRLKMSGPVKRAAGHVLGALAKAFQAIAPRQCNCFGFVVLHTPKLKPWMAVDGTCLDTHYPLPFNPAKYR